MISPMFGFYTKKATEVPTAPRIYLDHASATPVAPAVVAAMAPYWAEVFGNASAIHSEGVAAKRILTESRTAVARMLQVKPEGVTFTSGGTESNNLAILGVVGAARARGVAYADMEIITTKLEHPATLRAVEYLAREGVGIVYAPVDPMGNIVLREFESLLSPATQLVTVAYVNSEIGTIEDVGALGRSIAAYNREQGTAVLLHVDAAQAPLWLPCELPRLGADLLSLDAGKFGGPKGIGVLARIKGVMLETISYGGGQEAGLRPGTEPLALVVGLTTALRLAQSEWETRRGAVSALRDYFISQLQTQIPTAVLNGSVGEGRVANNVNISIPGLDSEFAVISLDVAGIACSTKSACSSAGGGESAVVMAISNDTAQASSTLRFTLGPDTTKTEIEHTVAVLQKFHSANLK
jgi:cysteine desulfurase